VPGRNGSVQRAYTGGVPYTRSATKSALIAPQFAAPYRKGGKHVKDDRPDAEAICEAASGRISPRGRQDAAGPAKRAGAATWANLSLHIVYIPSTA
jgi:hypothetical protein